LIDRLGDAVFGELKVGGTESLDDATVAAWIGVDGDEIRTATENELWVLLRRSSQPRAGHCGKRHGDTETGDRAIHEDLRDRLAGTV
jgi:hypothetical protein